MDALTQAFFVGLTDELEKGGMSCPTPGMKKKSKGKGKGLARGKGKGPMGMPTKKVGRRDMGKKAGVLKNVARLASHAPGRAKDLAKAVKRHGVKETASRLKKKFETAPDVQRAVKKVKRVAGFGKDAATAVPGPRGSAERKNVSGMLRSLRGIKRKGAGPKSAIKLRESLKSLKATGVPAKAMPPGPSAKESAAPKPKTGLVGRIKATLGLRKAKKGLKASGVPHEAVKHVEKKAGLARGLKKGLSEAMKKGIDIKGKVPGGSYGEDRALAHAAGRTAQGTSGALKKALVGEGKRARGEARQALDKKAEEVFFAGFDEGMGKGAGHISNYLYEKATGKKKKKLFGKGGLIHDTSKKKPKK
jgi:hypothetical protein